MTLSGDFDVVDGSFVGSLYSGSESPLSVAAAADFVVVIVTVEQSNENSSFCWPLLSLFSSPFHLGVEWNEKPGGEGRTNRYRTFKNGTYRVEKKSWYMVGRNFFLLLLTFSAWPCLGAA